MQTMASLSLFFGMSQQHLSLPLSTISLCTTKRVRVSLAFLCVCACSVTSSVLFVFVFTYALSCILYFFNCTILFPSIHSFIYWSSPLLLNKILIVYQYSVTMTMAMSVTLTVTVTVTVTVTHI